MSKATGRTLLVPTGLSWCEAPEVMPNDQEYVLILDRQTPQIGLVDREGFKGWVICQTRKKHINYDSFAGLNDSVFWSALPALNELRFEQKEAVS